MEESAIHSRRIADISALITAMMAVACVVSATAGGVWMIAMPMSWLLAPIALSLGIIALCRRQRAILAISAILLAIGAMSMPYLMSTVYLSNAVEAVSQLARIMA